MSCVDQRVKIAFSVLRQRRQVMRVDAGLLATEVYNFISL